MAQVTGDPGGVRTLSQSLGTTAATVHGQTVGFAQACSTIHPSVFTGPAGDRMRSNVSQLQAASAALAEAYDRVASFLPRVADAIEKAQEAERTEQRAAQALSQSEQALGQAQLQLEVANAAVPAAGSPGPSAFGPSLTIGVPGPPTPAQVAAQIAAQQAVQRAQHQVDLDRQAFHIAQQRFDDAEQHRRTVLAQLTALCQSEAQIAERALPALTLTSPLFTSNPLGDSPFAVATLRSELTSLLEVPTIAGSPKGVPLLGYLMTAAKTHNAGAVQALDNYVTQPIPRPQPHPSGGGNFFDDLTSGHLGQSFNDAVHAAKVALPYVPTVLVAGGSIALIVGTGGAAAPVIAGIGGLTGTAGTATVEALRGQKLNPVAMPVNGLIGLGSALVPGLLPEGSGIPALLGARAGTGAVGSTASQLLVQHRINLGTVGASAALGLNPLPGPSMVEGTSAGAIAAKVELGAANSLPSWLNTTNSSPASAPPGAASNPLTAGACPP
ncbi:MAG: hypothetical protein M3Y91_17485 [Actinomycetota bacterium]|nr:hypothetical protein [Actinomycetota bacterium]